MASAMKSVPRRVKSFFGSQMTASRRFITPVTHQCEVYKHTAPGVNMQYISDVPKQLPKPTHDNGSGEVSSSHWDAEWSPAMLQEAAECNAMNTWGPSKPVVNAPVVDRAEGVFVYDKKGRKYL